MLEFWEGGDSSWPEGQLEIIPKADTHVLKRSYGEDMERLFPGRGLRGPFSTSQNKDVQKLDAHRPQLAGELAVFHPGSSHPPLTHLPKRGPGRLSEPLAHLENSAPTFSWCHP